MLANYSILHYTQIVRLKRYLFLLLKARSRINLHHFTVMSTSYVFSVQITPTFHQHSKSKAIKCR